jgi:hypothetical protein
MDVFKESPKVSAELEGNDSALTEAEVRQTINEVLDQRFGPISKNQVIRKGKRPVAGPTKLPRTKIAAP